MRYDTGMKGALVAAALLLMAARPVHAQLQGQIYASGFQMPLAFVQVLFNGLVLVYDWPDVLLLIQGLAGVAFLAWIIDRAVTAPARPRVAVGAQSEAVS